MSVFSHLYYDTPISWEIATFVKDFTLRWKINRREVVSETVRASVRRDLTPLSVRMFLNFFEGKQRQMRSSEDLVADQGISIMLEGHPRQVMEGLMIPL